jgi:ubiquinone/menaquinone biosynthesis C-methylase UbiE
MEALKIREGIDPSPAMRRMAADRGITVAEGVGESLPYEDRCMDGVLMTTTLCFLSDPGRALVESARVLKERGHLVVGFIPADSPWGMSYARKGAEGHPIYSAARFYTSEQVMRLADAAGFSLEEARSCLMSPPDSPVLQEPPHAGIVPGAGFVALRFATRAGRC